MNKLKYLGFIICLVLPIVAKAQVSPIPVFEQEIRKGTSIKMRSSELERVKRDANKSASKNTNIKSILKFGEIKRDFEKIQKLQNSIIKAYTNGKKINYSKIRKSSRSMTKHALRLDNSLFSVKSDTSFEVSNLKDRRQKSVRTLIIELDNAIGKFVKSPVFKNIKIVDSKSSKNTQSELKNIIILSQKLSNLAERKK